MEKVLANKTVEKLLCQKVFTDINYRNIILDNFDERFFENNNICFIIKIVKEFIKQYQKMPDATVLKMIFERENNTQELLTDFKKSMDLDVERQEEFIRDSIIGYIQKKSCYYSIMDNIDDITERGEIDKVIKEFQEISQIDMISDLGLNFFDEHDAHMEEVCDPEALISTMYEQIDKALNGGVLQNGKALYVVMAQAGLGKSLMLSNLGVNFLMQGKTVAVVSLEMSELIYGKRMDAHITGHDVNHLPENADSVSSKIKDFKKLYNSTLYIKEFPPNSINTHKIDAYLTRLEASIGKKIDIIIIDYINLLRPNEKMGADMYERVGEVSRDMRALSYRFTAPVLSATQSNRCISINDKVSIFHKNKLEQITIKNVKVGDKILSNNNSNIVTKVYPIETQDVYKITTESGKSITCSARHVFPVNQINNFKQLSEIKVGDELFINNNSTK